MLGVLACAPLQATNRTIIEKDSEGNKKRVIELRDTVVDGQAKTDTLSIMTYENSNQSSRDDLDDADLPHRNRRSEVNLFSPDRLGDATEALVAIIALVCIFGLPLIIVFAIFFFRYKTRKAKYRLAEQALASGQPLPTDFFKNTDKVETEDIRSKGIKNIFMGLGLFIFFWAITGKFGVGCIGLLVMFMGFGQLIIYYTGQPGNGKPFIRIENDEKNRKTNVKIGGIEISNQEKDDKR